MDNPNLTNYVCKICNIPGHWIQHCPNKNKSQPPFYYICKICNIPGHWIQYCPNNNRNTLLTQPPINYTCNKCHQKGHWIKQCPLKFSIPPNNYICKICNIRGHWKKQCPHKGKLLNKFSSKICDEDDDISLNYNKMNDNIYVIGKNSCAQLGIHHIKPITKLTNWNTINKHISVKQVTIGNGTTIFTDFNDNYWVTGWNDNGECGINSRYRMITKCRKMKYFQLNNINISSVCTNINSRCVFWITDKNKLYGNGRNKNCSLGVGDSLDRNQPELIKSLRNVIDVQSGFYASIAIINPLFDIPHIISYISEYIFIPNDIIKLIIAFHGRHNQIYSTEYSVYGENGHAKNCHVITNKTWKRIQLFDDKNIIKVECGINHTLFLQSNGVVWCCGRNNKGQLGLGFVKTNKSMQPTIIQYFFKRNIKIKDIKCGANHNLAIDYSGNCFSWGDNSVGQCGIKHYNYFTPTPVTFNFKHYNIIKIKCGLYHSYVGTECGRHMLFGKNTFNQCMLSVARQLDFCINSTVHEITGSRIKDVYLGDDATIILVRK